MIRASLTSTELPELIAMSWTQAGSSVLGIASAILAMLVVRDVSARQTKRHQRMLESPPSTDEVAGDEWA